MEQGMKKQRKGSAYWLEHVAALNRQLISTSEYAKRHGIAVKRLYYWQRKLRAAPATGATPVRTSQAKAFVAVRVAEPMVEQRPFSCTLVLESGMRLEMSMLPAPAWLIALGRAAQGAR
jgi:transposase